MNSLETTYIAGGCFWCTEAVFQRLNGVHKIVSGYIGGVLLKTLLTEKFVLVEQDILKEFALFLIPL